MAEKKEETVREKIRRQYDNLSDDFVAAVETLYEEVVRFHERRVRLRPSRFEAVQENLERARRCLISLLVFDWEAGKRIPVIHKMWLIGEEGGKGGWVRFVFRQFTVEKRSSRYPQQ